MTDEIVAPDLNGLLDYGYELRGPKLWPKYLGGYLDRRDYVSASEIGNCERRIKLGKMGGPVRPFSRWGFAERGHLIEAWAIDLIREGLDDVENWELMFAGENQFSFTYGNQSGTPDGVLVNTDTNKGFVIDVKSVDPRTNWANFPREKDSLQVQQNCYLIEQCTPINVVGGIVWYIDASDLQKRKSYPIRVDQSLQQQLTAKADRIAAAESPSDMEPEGLYMDKQCDQCDHSASCSAIMDGEFLQSETHKETERATNAIFKR